MTTSIVRRTVLVAFTLWCVAMPFTAAAAPVKKSLGGTSSDAAQSLGIEPSVTCSGGSSLAGAYGVLVWGGGKFYSGELSFDGNCHVSGANITGSASGPYTSSGVTGTYAKNSDGSFNLNLAFANPASSQTYIMGVSESGNKARGIESDGSNISAIIDIQSQATSLSGGYNTASLSGAYVGDCAGVGNDDFNSLSFDGQGNVTVIDDFNAQGKATLTGTYAVNADGTFFGSVGGSYAYSFNGVMESGVSEIEYTLVQGGVGVLGCFAKSAMPAPANLSGYYGFVVGETSLTFAPGEYYSGSLHFDGAGHITATNVNGGINGFYGNTTATGVYTVNSDNTVSITLTTASPFSTQSYLVGVSENGNEAAGIQTDGAAISTIDLQSQLQLPGTTYTNASLAGTYSAYCIGNEIDLNWTTFDGNGNITAATDDYNDDGYGSSPYTGYYTVNSDGTFVANFYGSQYDVFTLTGVLDNSSSEIEGTYDLSGTGGVVGCMGESTYGPVGSAAVAATPTFGSAPGTYTSLPSVTLSDSTPGAAIYYTLNGATPTANSTVYTGAIALSATTTIQAIAVAGGYNNSAIASGTYFLSNGSSTAPTPTSNPAPGTYTSSIQVTLSDTASTAVIHYTTDRSAPTASSPIYGGAITVSAPTTINALAVVGGLNNSLVYSATYTIPLPTAPAPSFSPQPGTFSAPPQVTIGDGITGSTVYYTTDGSTPTTKSAIYGGPITISSSTTINAIVAAPGYNNSAVGEGVYSITSTGSFTLVQHANNTACATATTCTITLNQNIHAGDLLVFESSMYPASLIVGTDNGGAYAPCISCAGNDPTSQLEQTSGGWVLSSAAEGSTITVNLNIASKGVVEMWEYSTGGVTPGFDGANVDENENSAFPIAHPFTPSGTNDITVQACRANAHCNSVSAPFTADNAGNYFAWAALSEPTTWSGPTWSLQNPGISQLTQMEFGFGVTPCANSTFVDFNGTSGNTVNVAQLNAGTHGWAGGYWTVNGVVSDLTFQSAASQLLERSTGRLCDGGTYTDSSTTGLQYLTNSAQTFLQMNGTNGMLPSTSVSVGSWLYSNVPQSNTAGTDDIAIFGTGGTGNAQDYMLLHEFGYSGYRLAEIECGSGTSSGNVVLNRNTWYWADLVYNKSGFHTMKIYNNANPPVQVGPTMTCPAKGTQQPGYVTLGNVNTDPNLPPGYVFYFDGVLVSLDGNDPLLPTGAEPTAAAPTFNPPAAIYTSFQNVTLATTTPNATIHYTIDGSVPTTSSPTYLSAIAVDSTTTINAIATANGYGNSAEATAAYTLNLPPAATPTFTPTPGTFTSTEMVGLSDSTTGAIIYYTTDGSAPTTGSAQYSGLIPVSTTTTINAIAVASGYSTSATASGVFTINLPAAPTPSFTPPAGIFTSPQAVTLTDTINSPTIYYTTNGSTPTIDSTVYGGSIPVNATTTIKAIAIGTGYSSSPVLSGTFTINLPTAGTPTFNPPPAVFTSVQQVALTATPPTAVIHYTLDGSTPTPNSPVYSSAITVSTTTTIEAIAVATGYNNSGTAIGTFTINLPTVQTPTFTPLPGTFVGSVAVTISEATAGATIHYTTNGDTPTANSAVYSGAITVTKNTTIQALAVALGYNNSSVASGKYYIGKSQSITFPAIATQTNPAGTVTMAATATSGLPVSYAIVSGPATVSGKVVTLTGSGSVTVQASQAGSSSWAPATPVSQSFTVVAITTTTVTSSQNPSAYNQPISLTATITSSAGSPPNGETVTFEKGSTVIGTALTVGGTATLSSYSSLPLGNSQIRAIYGGDATLKASTSAILQQTVSKAASTLTLTSSGNPATAGPVTFSVTANPQFSGTPTGSIVFKKGSTVLKTVALSAGQASVTTTLTTGSYTITATYAGGSDFTGSNATLPETVN